MTFIPQGKKFQRIITPVKRQNRPISIIVILILLAALSACGGKNEADPAGNDPAQTPTATEQPMAARVNGEGILLSDFEEELQRYQSAAEQAGEAFDTQTGRQAVLDFLIEQTLFMQSAFQGGYVLNDADLQAQMDMFAEARGGQDGLNTYKSENFYTEESFNRTVARDMAVIWMRNQLLSEVPSTAEQVHARQILVRTENEAIAIQRQLEVGTPFKDLAFQYDPLTGGDLSWFPRGFLFQPAVEEAAFALQAGQYSGAIATDYGFHIIEVIERDAQHPLSNDALVMAYENFLKSWLDGQKAQSTIEIYVN